MAKLSLREAVKHFDVSRPTLLKALKSGRVSAVKDGKGQWKIDPAELTRVYQARPVDTAKVDNDLPGKLSTLSRPLPGELDAARDREAAAEQRAAAAEHRAAVAEALAEERARHIDDLRRMLPSPTAATPTTAASARPWWRKIF